jgi:hypothetical protein
MMTVNQTHFPRRKLHLFSALCVTTAAGIFCSLSAVGTTARQITHVPGPSFLTSKFATASFLSALLYQRHATRHPLYYIHNVLPYPILQFYIKWAIIIIIITTTKPKA